MRLLFLAILSVCLIALASYIGIGKPAANIIKTTVIKPVEKIVAPPALSKETENLTCPNLKVQSV